MSVSLLALDPGGTTGWSIWTYGPDEPLKLLEHGQAEGGVLGFSRWAHRVDNAGAWFDQVVVESFVDDGRTEFPDITPLRIEGAVEAVFGVHGSHIVYQRNVMKAHAPDALLKRAGFWFVGQPHATDSARHAIAYLKVRDHRPTIDMLWPRRHRPAVVADAA